MAGSNTAAFDLRDWIDKARERGLLKDVVGADLKYEIGTITDINAQRLGPAFLFSKSIGSNDDSFRLLTGSMNNAATVALTMGLEGPPLSSLELVNKTSALLRSVESNARDYPVEYVKTGPVMENQRTGDDIDLTIFPTPTYHEKDGGPFIGTGCYQIHQDPDTGWTNLATYRVQLFGKDVVGNFIAPGHHGNMIRAKYWAQGKPCPVVMCFGAHPLFLLIGSSDVPPGVDEMSWIGASVGRRVPVIKGPVTGLPIPADAEIVIEGYAYPDDTMIEGPFGEFTGYYAGGQRKEAVVRVKALYYRNQAIQLGSPPGRPPHDNSYYFSVMRSAHIMETLHRAGVPAVKGVWLALAGCGRMWIVTSISQKYAGHASAAAAIACTCQAGGLMARYSIVVDDDIDPTNNDDVIWALSTRSDPGSDFSIINQSWSTPLDPTLSDEAKAGGRLWNNRVLINACRPFDRLSTFAPVAEAGPEFTKAVKEKWASLFT